MEQEKNLAGTLDSVLVEERVFRPLPMLAHKANADPRTLAGAREAAGADMPAYWEEAAEELAWFKKWDTVLDDSEPPNYRWFTGGKTNIVYNALDRHIETANKNKLALIWEGEAGETRKYTYYELFRAVNRFANALRTLGVGRGDTVAIYMPPLPETIIAMLATAKIGAVHTLVFAGFASKALGERIRAVKAKVVVTCDGFYRNGRVIRVKDEVDDALMTICTDCVDSVIVVHRANVETEMYGSRDMWYEDLVRQERPVSVTEVMDAEDPLFVLHTSGTTGTPKGIRHAHGGYMVGVHRTFDWVFDIKPTDIYWSTADLSWVTGHSYGVYGPLMAGATTLMYEGHPLYPQADRLWNIIAKYGVTILYTSPTTIRMLKRFGTQYPRTHDLSTLRLLGTVGEPISPETWMWYYDHIGGRRCPVLDTWWQTETGMIMVSPMPVSFIKPGSVAKPLPGVSVDVVDAEGDPVPPGKGGFLVVTKPWPAMFQKVLGDEKAAEAYWNTIPGAYFAGDVARKDEDGYIWIQGRADDVLNIAGHRLGTAELEAAMISHKAVEETACVGVPDPIRGQAAKFYVVLTETTDPSGDLIKELMAHVRRELGPIATVKTIQFVDELPKTTTGKITRLPLK